MYWDIWLIVYWFFVIALPIWFTVSLIVFKKKERTTGRTVNLVLASIGLVAWVTILIVTACFFLLASLIVRNM